MNGTQTIPACPHLECPLSWNLNLAHPNIELEIIIYIFEAYLNMHFFQTISHPRQSDFRHQEPTISLSFNISIFSVVKAELSLVHPSGRLVICTRICTRFMNALCVSSPLVQRLAARSKNSVNN